MALEILTKEENLLKNLVVIKSKFVGKKVCAVLNANAYGHDMVKVARLLDDNVDGFFVSDVIERDLLIRHGVKNPIRVLMPTNDDETTLDFYQNVYAGDFVEKEFVRCNLSLFGYPRGEFYPVMEVYTEVLDTFNLPPYTNVDWCKVGRLGANMAIIKGGFADGIGRDFVGSHLLIKGKPYPVVAVFTNLTILRVDGDVNAKDRVCICGNSEGRFRYFDQLALEVDTDIRELMIRFGNSEKNGKI